MRRRDVVGIGLAVLALTACTSGPTTTPTPTPVSAQRQVCGALDVETCQDAIRLVGATVPETTTSPLATADAAERGPVRQLGGSFVILVTFQPEGSDLPLDLAELRTWVVTEGMRGTRVEAWTGGTLPAHYVELLDRVGMIDTSTGEP